MTNPILFPKNPLSPKRKEPLEVNPSGSFRPALESPIRPAATSSDQGRPGPGPNYLTDAPMRINNPSRTPTNIRVFRMPCKDTSVNPHNSSDLP